MSGDQGAVDTAPDFQAWFESSPGLYLVLDPQLTIVGVSDAYLSATMTQRNKIIGKGLFEVFPDNPDDVEATGVGNLRSSLERVRQDLIADTMAVQKYDIRKPEAEGGGFEVRYWSPRNSPIISTSGALRYIIHQVEDVTEFVALKQHEAAQQQLTIELRTRTEQMGAEILRRSQELQESNRQLRIANAAKSEFLSRMSHELRTPFTAVLGFGELLSLTELDDEQHDYISNVLKAARHLLNLLDNILDISRIGAGHLSPSVEPVDVGPLLDDTFNLIRPLAASHGVELVETRGLGSYCVAADRQRLRQVLINLFSNAIKYNSKNGTVTVAVDEQGDDKVRIGVTDVGGGISADALERLFVPFERLDAAQQGIDGTGLGLALSRELAQNMGGTMGVASIVGKGSTFWIELPSAEPVVLDEVGDEHNVVLDIHSYPQKRCVLYVEDTFANVQLVEQILKRRPGVTLIPVMTGGAALDMARQHHPDLVLLDLHLPDTNGAEVLRRLRTDTATRSTPVIILSADATRRQVDELLADGAAAYLTKPIGVTALLEVIDSVFDEPRLPIDSRARNTLSR